MIILRWLHTIYAAILFVITFLLLFPFMFLFAQKEQWHKYAYRLTKMWGHIYFPLALIKINIEDRNKENWSRPCIYVANHFSFTDIAAFPLVANDACFVGKDSIKKAPLFGYFFSSLHITVNRSSMRDRAKALEQTIDVINKGKSLFIFPEGGIRSTVIPNQVKYKDGAFRTAIRTGVPIVPVTFPNNWRLFPDDGKYLLRSNYLSIVIHEAIDTSTLEETEFGVLREQVFDVIENELVVQNKDFIKP